MIFISMAKNHKANQDCLYFRVQGEGIGVPAAELSDVFDKFIQSSKTKSNAGGTGLGLAIGKEIIEAHQGSIWAENTLKGGVIFQFNIPVKIT